MNGNAAANPIEHVQVTELAPDLVDARDRFKTDVEARRALRVEMNANHAASMAKFDAAEIENARKIDALLHRCQRAEDRVAFQDNIIACQQAALGELRDSAKTGATALRKALHDLDEAELKASKRLHELSEGHRLYVEQFAHTEPSSPPNDDGGGDGGSHQPIPEPGAAEIVATNVERELLGEIITAQPDTILPPAAPTPVLPFAPKVARAKLEPIADDRLEIPTFLRRQPLVTGHADELFDEVEDGGPQLQSRLLAGTAVIGVALKQVGNVLRPAGRFLRPSEGPRAMPAAVAPPEPEVAAA